MADSTDLREGVSAVMPAGWTESSHRGERVTGAQGSAAKSRVADAQETLGIVPVLWPEEPGRILAIAAGTA
jgi:hypothetical protein